MAKLFRKLFILLTTFFSFPALAQETNVTNQTGMFDYLTTVMIFVLIVAIVVLAISLYLLYVVRLLFHKTQSVAIAEKVRAAHLESGTKTERKVWAQLSAKMTRAVPITEEESILLDHNYDGIQELDNHLPPWWKGLFYFTIVFSVIYMLVYHVIKPEWAPLQDEAYALEMVRFEEQRAQMANYIDENNVELTLLSEDLENGKQIYLNNCAACHRPDGGGSIGPNLADPYWIHGNSIQDVFAVIKYGVTGKMVPWESILSGKDMRDVASYVLHNLVGTDPENPRAPEGEMIGPIIGNESDSTKTILSEPVAALMK
jgi:cytochrome c oxidase cbb3-type subunit III